MFSPMFREGRRLFVPTLEVVGLFLLLWGIFLYMSGLLGWLEIRVLLPHPLFWLIPLALGVFGYAIQWLFVRGTLKKGDLAPKDQVKRVLFRFLLALFILLVVSLTLELGFIFNTLKVIRTNREIFLFVTSGVICYLLAFVLGLPTLAQALLKLPYRREIHTTVRLRFLYLNTALVSGGLVFLILLTFLFSKRSLEPEIKRNLLNSVRSVSVLINGIYQDFSSTGQLEGLGPQKRELLMLRVLRERLGENNASNPITPFIVGDSGKILFIGGEKRRPMKVVDPVTGKTLWESILSSPSGILEFFWPVGKRGERVVIRVLRNPNLRWIVGVKAPWEFIMEPVLNFSQRMFFLAGIFVLSILGVTFFTIKGPLSTLDYVIERLGKEPDRVQELEDISKSLDELINRLKYQEKAVTEYARRLSFLYREAMSLVRVSKTDEFSGAILKSALRAFEGDFSILLPLKSEGAKRVTVLDSKEESARSMEVLSLPDGLERALVKESPLHIKEEVPIVLSDVRIDSPWRGIIVPIRDVESEPQRLLVVKKEGTFLPEDTFLLGTLSSLASMVIERIRYEANLEDKVRERTKELLKLQKELEKANVMLREQAIRDPLTGVFNRRYMEEVFNNFQGKLKTAGLILLDLDGFKDVNDMYGHKAGDFLLKAVVRTVQNNLRVEDFIFRYGGDEFVVFLPNIFKLNVKKVAERLRRAVEDGRYLLRTKEGGISLKITASFGAVFVNIEKGIQLGESLIEADRAMYEAKRTGKNQVVSRVLEGENLDS